MSDICNPLMNYSHYNLRHSHESKAQVTPDLYHTIKCREFKYQMSTHDNRCNTWDSGTAVTSVTEAS